MGQRPPNGNGKSNFEKFVECVEAYAKRVNRTLALLFRLGKAIKDSVFFLAFLVIFITFVRVILWLMRKWS